MQLITNKWKECVNLNILYVHGFGSKFDHGSDKVRALTQLGTVHGVDVDYTQGPSIVLQQAKQIVSDKHIDLLVGTSMGGWCVSEIGSSLGIPFVAINPCIHPRVMLQKYIGKNTDHYGRSYVFTAETCWSYTDFSLDGCGLILLDRGDEVIDANATAVLLTDRYRVHVFDGGNHRFEHIAESLELIDSFYVSSGLIYGAEH